MKTKLTAYFTACLLGVSSDNHDINCETAHLGWKVAHDLPDALGKLLGREACFSPFQVGTQPRLQRWLDQEDFLHPHPHPPLLYLLPTCR